MICLLGNEHKITLPLKLKTLFEALPSHGLIFCVRRSEEPPYVAPFQPNHVSSAPRSSSRLSNSLLKYTPGQYSTMLRSTVVHTQETMTSTTQTAPPSSLHGQSRHEVSESESPAASEVSSSISPRARTSPSQVYTPFMRLMEMSAKMNIE